MEQETEPLQEREEGNFDTFCVEVFLLLMEDWRKDTFPQFYMQMLSYDWIGAYRYTGSPRTAVEKFFEYSH